MVLTQFNVWPEAGGILDQDPLFLRRLQQYTAVKNAHDEKERAAEERKNPKPRRRGK
jgi:hypothetical protein